MTETKPHALDEAGRPLDAKRKADAAEALRVQGRRREAVDLSHDCIVENPADDLAFKVLALVNAELRMYEAAECQIRRATAIDPFQPHHREDLAVLLDRRGRPDLAESERRQAKVVFELAKAQAFVGALGMPQYLAMGRAQFDLLTMNGCRPHHHVLEIGCGALCAGYHLVPYLESDRYVGIEPNAWLIEAAAAGLTGLSRLLEAKRTQFICDRLDFDASALGRRFDFVISHSILSHAAHWQLGQFFRAAAKVLAPSGVVIASIYFRDAEGRVRGDSMDEEWVYPGVSYFAWETVKRVAAESGLDVEERPDYRRYVIERAPRHIHDWIRLKRRS